mmetsp:Transcript_27644/g.78212  ORF Transcript_27644/g.78212 Transcript_27644/m.78212 type:complete len:372 (+) Transcript_27644:664-1779(+)
MVDLPVHVRVERSVDLGVVPKNLGIEHAVVLVQRVIRHQNGARVDIGLVQVFVVRHAEWVLEYPFRRAREFVFRLQLLVFWSRFPACVAEAQAVGLSIVRPVDVARRLPAAVALPVEARVAALHGREFLVHGHARVAAGQQGGQRRIFSASCGRRARRADSRPHLHFEARLQQVVLVLDDRRPGELLDAELREAVVQHAHKLQPHVGRQRAPLHVHPLQLLDDLALDDVGGLHRPVQRAARHLQRGLLQRGVGAHPRHQVLARHPRLLAPQVGEPPVARPARALVLPVADEQQDACVALARYRAVGRVPAVPVAVELREAAPVSEARAGRPLAAELRARRAGADAGDGGADGPSRGGVHPARPGDQKTGSL